MSILLSEHVIGISYVNIIPSVPPIEQSATTRPATAPSATGEGVSLRQIDEVMSISEASVLESRSDSRECLLA